MLSSIRNVSTLLLGVALLLTGHGLQMALVPLRGELLGWSSMAIGALGSAYFGGYLAGCFCIPKLVGQIGHIRTFAALTAVMTSVILSLALFDHFAFWLALRFITGIAISGLYLVVESWLNENTSNDVRGGMLAIYTAIVLAGLAIGQLLLNLAPIGDNQLIIFAGVLVVLAAIPICMTRTIQPQQIPTAGFSPLLVLKTSRAAAAGSLIAGIVTGSYYSFGPVYGLEIGMDVVGISTMMALGIAGGAISQLPLGRLSDTMDRRLVILATMAVGAIVLVVSWFVHISVIPYFMLLFGACVMPIYALSLAHASDNIQAQSFLEVGTGLLVINAVGAIFGPLLTAQSMHWFGPQGFFLSNAAVLFLGAALVALLIRSNSPSRDHFAEFELATTASAQGAIQMDPRAD